MKILTLDLSLTGTGWCYRDTDVEAEDAGTFKPGKLRGAERLAKIRDFIKVLILHHKPEAVFIEGMAFGAMRGHDLGQIQGVIQVLLFDYKIKFYSVAPTSLKKYVTGSGRADKELMMMKALKRFGFESKDNNECDARCLARFAEEIHCLGINNFKKKYGVNVEINLC